MAEVWTLTTDVPGVGRKGDVVVYDPDDPDPRFRLAVVSPRRVEDLDAYLDAIRRVQGYLGPGKGAERPHQPRRPVQLVEE